MKKVSFFTTYIKVIRGHIKWSQYVTILWLANTGQWTVEECTSNGHRTVKDHTCYGHRTVVRRHIINGNRTVEVDVVCSNVHRTGGDNTSNGYKTVIR